MCTLSVHGKLVPVAHAQINMALLGPKDLKGCGHSCQSLTVLMSPNLHPVVGGQCTY